MSINRKKYEFWFWSWAYVPTKPVQYQGCFLQLHSSAFIGTIALVLSFQEKDVQEPLYKWTRVHRLHNAKQQLLCLVFDFQQNGWALEGGRPMTLWWGLLYKLSNTNHHTLYLEHFRYLKRRAFCYMINKCTLYVVMWRFHERQHAKPPNRVAAAPAPDSIYENMNVLLCSEGSSIHMAPALIELELHVQCHYIYW